MKITLQTMDPQMRKALGWENKTEEAFEISGNTLADFFRKVKDKDGRALYDRFMDEHDIVIANSYIFYNCRAFLKKEDLDRYINDGDKVVLMRSLASCGAG